MYPVKDLKTVYNQFCSTVFVVPTGLYTKLNHKISHLKADYYIILLNKYEIYLILQWPFLRQISDSFHQI